MNRYKCYNCAVDLTQTEVTREHIPPKCLSKHLPPEQKQKLLTVPCCLQCNQDFAKIDSTFRDFVIVQADGGDSNPEEALKKTIRSLVQNKNSGFIGDPSTSKVPDEISFDRKDIEEIFIKCHKGVFYHINQMPMDSVGSWAHLVFLGTDKEWQDTPLQKHIMATTTKGTKVLSGTVFESWQYREGNFCFTFMKIMGGIEAMIVSKLQQ